MALLQRLVVRPPVAASSVAAVEARSFPHAPAEGAYGRRPTPERARRAGCRLQAPTRGAGQPGIGKMRSAVERCQNFCAQCGRVYRRCDRSARRSLAWIDMAACVILLRSGFVSES
jgi:transposase